jgi:hypothetical protein
MIRIANIFKNNRQMKALTGLSIAEFNILLVSFEIILYEYFARRARKRGVGGGRKGALLDAADKIISGIRIVARTCYWRDKTIWCNI